MSRAEGSPIVSVVIPTRDRPQLLADTLDSLAEQTLAAAMEVVVVDDGSIPLDGVIESRSDAPYSLRLESSSRRGINAARNVGLARASGAVVCLLDDDVSLPPTWAEAFVRGLERHPRAAVAGGPVRLRLESSGPRRCGREPLGETELELGDEERVVDHVFGGNLAVRRSVLESVQPFDEGHAFGYEEMAWQRRIRAAGHEIVFVPDAWFWHRRAAGDLRFRRLLRRRFLAGVGYARFLRSTGERVPVSETLKSLPGFCLHAVRYRCSIGVFYLAGSLGQMCETLRGDVVDLVANSRRP